MLKYFDQIVEPLLIQSYTILFFTSFILCLVVILSSSYGFSRRSTLDQTIQSAHSGFVPRVGGWQYTLALSLIPLSSPYSPGVSF